MNNRDCESCKKFSRATPECYVGYCEAKRTYVAPEEDGEECEQFEPYTLYCDTDSSSPARKICPYYMKYCDCEDEEYATCDLSSVYPRQTEEMFDTPFGSMKANNGKSDDPITNALFDTRAIKPEKYAELREQDFDTWLDTILHEIIEQVNFDASEVDSLGDAVWNGECPDGTPYPKQCAREDAYIQCIRQSNQLDALKAKVEDLENQINDITIRFEEFKKFVGYTLADPTTSPHTCSNFCGNCSHYQEPTSSITLPTCKLSGEIVDPDDSSCAMFEPPF